MSRRAAPRLTLLLAALLLPPPTARACVVAFGECRGDTHHLSVSVGTADTSVVAVVLRREWIGACRPAEFVPDEPIPISCDGLSPWEQVTVETDVPAPEGAAVFRYTPHLVRADGTVREVPLSWCGGDSRTYALVTCDDVPLVRGRLVLHEVVFDQRYFQIEPCAADCWTESGWSQFLYSVSNVERLSGLTAQDLWDQTVDVYGTRTYCTLPGGAYYDVTRIALTEGGGCGSVPAQRLNWGDLKTRYR